MIASLVEMLGPWSWWVLGILLAAVEIVAPGAFFLWFAVAAVLVGALAFLVEMSWQTELVLFAILAVVSALVGRQVYGKTETTTVDPRINDRLRRHVGRLAVMETALANGAGHIRLDDTLWRVQGPDLPAGTPVTVVDVVDGRLQVAPR